jgi:Transposase DDE domain/Domain of unknown function (DUF4372)
MMALLGGHGHEKGRAMKHRNSVVHGMLGYLPGQVFDDLVAAHEADKWVRTLSTKCQFVALLIGQLSGFCGLRETVAGVNSQAARLYHLGAREIARSTFADANAHRPSAVFEELFAALVAQAGRGLRRTLDGATYLIDSTSLRLNQHSADWARHSATVCGAKVHVIYDPDADQPIGACPRAGQGPDPWAAFSTATVNDISAAHDMPIVAGATYVFDLGYYDYGWWAKLHAADCRIVTRLKKNTPLTVTRERLIPPGGIATSSATILSDRIGHLPARQAGRRSNPMSDEVREVRVRLDTGKVLRILTNDLVASAHAIAEIYKQRRQIELFFRWIKQRLEIKRFIGTSENAVRIQVAVALIAFLLMRLAHAGQTAVPDLLAFVRSIRVHLLSRRDINALNGPERLPGIDPRQLSLDRCFA